MCGWERYTGLDHIYDRYDALEFAKFPEVLNSLVVSNLKFVRCCSSPLRIAGPAIANTNFLEITLCTIRNVGNGAKYRRAKFTSTAPSSNGKRVANS